MWDKIFFGDFIELQRGFDLPEQAREEGEFPVIASTNIVGYHNEFKVLPPCVVTGRSGSLGFVQFIEKPCFPLNTTLFVKDFKGNHPCFVYYFLKTLKLEQYNSGVGVPTLNRNDLDKIEIKIPPPSIQRRIADVLGRYDALIENYQRQIGLLEAMAQEIYWEWFVRGRCPYAREQANELPVGWERVRFTDVISVLSGGTPKTSVQQYWDGDILWFSPSDVRNSFYVLKTEKTITELGLKNCNSKLYPANTVVITARGTVGRCVLLGKPMAINQSNYALIGKNLSQFFVYFKMLEMAEKLKKEAIGAVFETITVNNFENAEIVLPSDGVLAEFDRLIEPIFRKLRNCLEQVELLRKLRDKLLPRLISGQLEVAGRTAPHSGLHLSVQAEI